MKWLEAVGKSGETIKVQAITKRIDVTNLESVTTEWIDNVQGVIIDGRQVTLNLDDTFHHPVTGELYNLQF